MSQVSVNRDRLNKSRTKALNEERRIRRDRFQKRLSNATRTLLVERCIGLACIPVFVLWAGLTLLLGFVVSACAWVLRILGELLSRRVSH